MERDKTFEEAALVLYRHQYTYNPLYQAYNTALGKNPSNVHKLTDIPFLPIQFFKTHKVKTENWQPQGYFESSGTTSSTASKHYIQNYADYEQSFLKGFETFWGKDQNYTLLALTPHYLERGNSSLVYMLQRLIEKSHQPTSGFYLNDYAQLNQTITKNEATGITTLLWGVTYALIDFATVYPQHLAHTTVIETGGMKGRKQEMSRKQVHSILKNKLGINKVASEYGMTELFSQAYADADGIFKPASTLRVLVRDLEEPLLVMDSRQLQAPYAGLINLIDLSNKHSVAFIATDDIGILHPNGNFEITGRLQGADLRGCSLMVADLA